MNNNIQAMMKQAQKLQQNMINEKEKIDSQDFIGKSSFVQATLKGTKKISNIKIDKDLLEKDDIEMLEDMLVVAINDAMSQIDEEVDKKLGKYTKGMPGLF